MLLKSVTLAFIIWLVVIAGFVMLHEDTHAKICKYYGGNATINYFKAESWDIKSFMVCDNLDWNYVDFNQYELAQSNVESASIGFVAMSGFLMTFTFFGFAWLEIEERKRYEKKKETSD